MRPGEIPVRPLASRAVLPPDAVAALFGKGATLRETARVSLVQNGREIGQIAVVPGASLPGGVPSGVAVSLDQTDAVRGSVKAQGPVGVIGPVAAEPVQSRLVLPDGLRRAWGVGERATLGLGAVAVSVSAASGAEAVAEIERALWLGAGRPQTARWLPGVDWAREAEAEKRDDGALVIARRVVTETDVRQARTRRRRIRLGPGQIVTPAARSLADEWDVFETPS